jgi:hypothetical protein
VTNCDKVSQNVCVCVCVCEGGVGWKGEVKLEKKMGLSADINYGTPETILRYELNSGESKMCLLRLHFIRRELK